MRESGGVAIAYQVVGDGDTDLVYVPDYMSNLIYGWEYPRWRDFYLLLAERFKVILFDKRGTGLSDHGGQFATLETRMEDLHAVLDAAGSTRTVILAPMRDAGWPPCTRRRIPSGPPGWRCSTPEPAVRGSTTPSVMAGRAPMFRDRWGSDALADEIIERRLSDARYRAQRIGAGFRTTCGSGRAPPWPMP